ncbi:uncharacterized protein LOC116616811 [Nematostella vectensis]|uniref:uncharacterized protein LOC116616811 n=1 Tax=Nematostella vectensis TaxID=45351 RepID=UPI0020774C0F|nr:uncharacterized protein LOC116616811 [Nematostella vectensis]
MFVKSREPPSVVSTRVLRTHRLNEIETFRLQERIRSIVGEGKKNYSSISDEIDGVRENLNKIKKVKNNLGISVERRKLLREKGYRVLPIRGLGDEPIALRGPDGKKIELAGRHCYDGEQLRKQLNIRFEDLNLCEEKHGDESVKDEDEVIRRKDFEYRVIGPPLRPGSRRNFKDVSDKESEKEQELLLLSDTPKAKRKVLKIRPHTAVNRRGSERRISRSGSRDDIRRARNATAFHTSSVITCVEDELYHVKGNKKMGQDETQIREKQKESAKTVISIEENNYNEINRPDSQNSDGTRDNIEKDKFEHFDERLVAAVVMQSRSEARRSSRRTMQTVQDTTENTLDRNNNEIKVTKTQPSRRISVSDPKLLPRRPLVEETTSPSPNSFIEEAKTNKYRKPSLVESSVTMKVNGEKECRRYDLLSRKQRGDSVNSRGSGATGKSMHFQGVRRPSVGVRKDALAYDARPDVALSKGYSTMQMTIGGKQVKLFVPKFTTEVFDEVVDRARAKSNTRPSRGNPVSPNT